MIPAILLTDIVVAEAILLTAGILALILHGSGLWWYRRLTAERIAGVRQQLVALLSAPESESLELSSGLSPSVRARILVDLARNLDGVGRQRLTRVSHELGLIYSAERLCRSRRWSKRLEGARLLTLFDEGADIMPGLLRDPDPMVRAQAAEWAGDHPTPAVIASLFDLLEDDQTISRYAVQDSLSRIGDAVVPALASYISTHSGLSVVPALKAAARLADVRLVAPALWRCQDPDPRVRALAADLVGVLAGQESVNALLQMLSDPVPEVRAAATRGLGRLAHWPAAPTVAPLLRDPHWIVRRESGLALRSFGAPGILLLRRMLSDADSFAADMARQVLDLPALYEGVVA